MKKLITLLMSLFILSCNSKKESLPLVPTHVQSYYNYGGLGFPLFDKWKALKSEKGLSIEGSGMRIIEINRFFVIDKAILHDTLILSYLQEYRSGYGFKNQFDCSIKLSDSLDLMYSAWIEFEGDSAQAFQILNRFQKETKILDSMELRQTFDSLYPDGINW